VCVKFSPSEDRHLFRSGEGWPAQIVNKLNSGCLVLVASFLETRRNETSKQNAVGILEVKVGIGRHPTSTRCMEKSKVWNCLWNAPGKLNSCRCLCRCNTCHCRRGCTWKSSKLFQLGCGEGDFHTSMAAPPKRLRGCLVRASSRVLLFLCFLSLESYERMSPPFKVDGACFPSTDFISCLHYIYIYLFYIQYDYTTTFFIYYIEINIDIQYIHRDCMKLPTLKWLQKRW